MDELPKMDLFGALLFQVTGQQLSVASTRRTIARLEEVFGGHLPSPAEVLAVDAARLRDAGLSWRKVGTLRDLAERLSDGRLDGDALSGLADDEVIAQLTAVPGIGPWTAQGALLIALGREDVVLPGDLALRKAIQDVYRLDHLPTQQEVLVIAEKWRPYRSLGTAYLFSAAYDRACDATAVVAVDGPDGGQGRRRLVEPPVADPTNGAIPAPRGAAPQARRSRSWPQNWPLRMA